jgi:hypothetical protein
MIDADRFHSEPITLSEAKMAASQAERQFLDALVEDPEVAFTAEDREALLGARIPIGCLVKCAVALVGCGPTNPKCIGEFAACVLACFGGGGRDAGSSNS